MPKWIIVHAQDDPNLRILRMLEGTFLLDMAYIYLRNVICTGWKVIAFIQAVPEWTWHVPQCVTMELGFRLPACLPNLFWAGLFLKQKDFAQVLRVGDQERGLQIISF